MPARINKKVVVPLIAVLMVVVLLVVGLGLLAIRRSPGYYKAKGDAAAKVNDWETAEEFYSKAVNRDQGNIELIDLWLETIYKIVPEDGIKAREYFGTTNNIIKKKTEVRPFEVTYHLDWLSQFFELTHHAPSVADATALANEADLMLRAKPASDDDPRWDQAYRYRGLGNTYRLRDSSAGPSVIQSAIEDLDRALAAKPDDSDAATAKVFWHAFTARGLAQQNKTQECMNRLGDGIVFAREYLKTNPNDLQVWMALANILQTKNLYDATALGLEPDETVLDPVIARVEELALTSSDVPWWLAIQSAGWVLSTSEQRQEAAAQAQAIIDRALAADPDQPYLLLEHARYVALQGKPDEAVAEYQKLVDHPNLPVGFNGRLLFDLRPRAIEAQCDIDINRWRRTDPSDEQAWNAARQRAADRIAAFRSLTTESDVELLYLDGRFALSNGQADVAAMKLSQFDNATGTANLQLTQRMTALLDLAAALTRSGQQGAAYAYLDRANQLAGGAFIEALVAMINLDIQAQRADRALDRFEQLRSAAPDYEGLASLRDRIRILQKEDPLDDAAAQAIINAREEITSGNTDAAERILTDQLAKSPDDQRLLMELVRLARSREQDEVALRYVRQALAAGEDPTGQWRILEAILTKADVKPVIDQIVQDQGLRTEIERWLLKWRMYNQFELTDDANEALAAARAINPDHPEILDHDFTSALGQKDYAKAQQIASRAERVNADQANGLTYRGRLELDQGKLNEAIGTLIHARDLKPYDGNVWRFLGIAYRESGNYESARDALKKSLDRNPSNVGTLRELARLQIRSQDFKQALSTITKAHNLEPGNTEVESLYLELEGVYGDRPKIVAIREKVYKAEPGDLNNALSLVALYMLDNRYDDARGILQQLHPDEATDQLRVTRAWADWNAKQGRIDAGKNVFDDLLASKESWSDADRLAIMLAQGDYLVGQNRIDDGIAAYEAARANQDPAQREADRRIGQLRISLGDLAGAIEPLESALSADTESPMLLLQLISVHLDLASQMQASDSAGAQTHRDRAEALLKRYESKNEDTVETLLLAGEIAAQRGNYDTAERLYNSAVAKYPQVARVYTARARFNLLRMSGTNDASRVALIKSDVEQAMRVNPGDPSPLFLIVRLANARVDVQTGAPMPDTDLLISTYRRILQIAPRQDDVRIDLVQLMYAQGNYTQADLLIQEAINLAPDEAPWYEVRGNFMKQRGSGPEEYAVAYADAFQRQPNASRLLKLTTAWMESNPPAATRSLALLNEFNTEVEANPMLQLNKARALFKLGRMDDSRKVMVHIADEINLCEDPAQREQWIRAWFNSLPFVLPESELVSISDSCFPDKNDPWPLALLGKTLYGVGQGRTDPESADLRNEGLKRLLEAKALLTEHPDTSAQTLSLRQDTGWWIASAYYMQDQWSEAVESWRWILESNPDHVPTLNNLAYVLADKLNKPAEALDAARHVYEVAPRDATMLDTYGYVLLKNGQLDEAERILRTSLDIQERIVTMLHLGELLAAKEDLNGARRMYNRARNRAVEQKDTEQIAKIDELIRNLPK